MSTATLFDVRATHSRLSVPAWGVPWAEVSLDGEHKLAGQSTLKIADLSVVCSVVSGGPAKGRSYYRVAAGRASWGKEIPAKSYANDAGVKASDVLLDAAAACGEEFDVSTLPTTRLGPSWQREAGPASRALSLIAPQNWYVGEDGKTRIGRRPSRDLTSTASIGVIDRGRGMIPIAAESIVQILPGVRVEGLEALDVQHEVSPDGLRSKIWTAQRTVKLRRIIDALYPEMRFRGVYEYRVVTQEGERLNLQPIRVSLGMPDVRRAFVRPGVPGCRADVVLGSRVLVAFVDADPARPVVVGFEDAEGAGFAPDRLDLVGDDDPWVVATEGGRVVRYGDTIVFPVGSAGTPTAMPVTGLAAAGPPPISVSRVRA